MEIINRDYKGAELECIELKSIIGSCATDKKVMINGTLSVGKLVKSNKFKPELQLQLYTKENFEIKDRSSNGWNRIEIFIPLENTKEIIEFLKYTQEKKEVQGELK